MKQVLLLLILTFGFVRGDIYIQGFRGSNNRLDEANRERNNANRLFDSQNNNRGGYNVGKINVFESEEVTITWTNQHGCNTNDTRGCHVHVQIMCDELLRDGTTTERIPTNPAQCRNFNCDLDVRYGRHESYAFYQKCQNTERNKGLFLASQKLNDDRATRTRQNPGGTRRGYECPEERDYYPYWRPSPWKDVVMFTKDTSQCDEYKKNSENVLGRWECVIPDEVTLQGNQRIPIEKEKCEELEFTTADGNKTTAEWVQQPSHGWPEPDCLAAEATRTNHLGLIGHRKQWTYVWKVPEFLKGAQEAQCALRVRYNITQDYDPFLRNEETGKIDSVNPGEVTAQYNAGPKGNNNNSPATLPIWEEYGLTYEDVKCSFYLTEEDCDSDEDSREYVLVNNPQVAILGGDYMKIKLQLAINTAQYGRTFQDRTHQFLVRPRPSNLGKEESLTLLSVSGKRGNIVQTFPGHEYFFVPEVFSVRQGNYMHVEITGSDTNPNNNDGQGRKGTDRSNMCIIKDKNYANGGDTETTDSVGAPGNNYPAFVKKPTAYSIPEVIYGKKREIKNADGEVIGTEDVKCREPDHYSAPMAGMDEDVQASLCTGRSKTGVYADSGNMEELDDAGTSLVVEPIKMKKVGCWNYLSTRNNNFSNRSQKGKICVNSGEFQAEDIGKTGGALTTDAGWLAFQEGTLDTIYSVTFETSSSKKGDASPVVTINPPELSFNEGESAELAIDYTHRALRKPRVMHQSHGSSSWEEIGDVSFEERSGKTVAIFQISEAGHYKVEDSIHGGAAAAIVVIGLIFIIVLSVLGYCRFFRKSSGGDDFNSSLQSA